MNYTPYYSPGDYLVICDVCGFKYKRSQTRKRWDNMIVCDKDYEERHPQDLIRIRAERQNVKDARPEGEDRFISVGDVTVDDL